MKNTTKTIILLYVSVLISCSGGNPTESFSYDLNPQFKSGEMEYFGKYYSGINSNVITLSFYTEKLVFNDLGLVEGLGQHLKFVDVFLPSTDSTLLSGTYNADITGAPFTFYTKAQKSTDKNKYPFAIIKYFESAIGRSTEKYVDSGKFAVSKSGKIYSIDFELTLSDKSIVKGTFNGEIGLRK